MMDMKSIIIGSFVAAFGLGLAASMTMGAGKPNVLLISLDDLNDWIEPMGGHPQAPTPNLASFAKESIQDRAIPLRSIVDN